MEPNKDVFQYTYSAKQQEEIEAIRKKYLPPQVDMMEQLAAWIKAPPKRGQLSPLWWAWRAAC